MQPEPFEIHISDDVLDDLHRRLDTTRWPDELPGTVGTTAPTWTT